MPSKIPFFSVVIPTKNRVEPLRLTLQSVLLQEFTDWECVVVDNNDDDKLKDLLAEMADSRLRVVKTGGLHMADNWDAALRAGIGEYIVLINDKQCLYGHTLLFAHQTLKDGKHELLVWGSDVLNDRNPSDISFGGRMGNRKFSVLQSDDVLAEFTIADKSWRRNITSFPRRFIVGCHSVVRRSILEDIRRETGQKICLPVNPDLTIGCHLLNRFTGYLFYHGEMSFFHSLQVSSSVNMMTSRRDVNNLFVTMGGEDVTYRHIPIKCMITECHHFNDYIYMRKLLGGRLSHFPLSWVMFYVTVHECLRRSKEGGMDRTLEMKAWWTALNAESLATRLQVFQRLLSIRTMRFRRNLRKWSGLPRLESFLKGKKTTAPRAPEKISSARSFLADQTRLLRAVDLGKDVASTAHS